VNFKLNPLPKQLGQKYGSTYPKLREQIVRLSTAATEAAASRLIQGDPITVEVEGEAYLIESDEVEVRIEAQEGFAAAAEGAYLVALDTTLTPELQQEGLAREFVRRVQDLRKKSGFQVDDRIRLYFQASEEMREAIAEYEQYIKDETLSLSMEEAAIPDHSSRQEYKLDQEHLTVGIVKV
jgi:isoleucyl-tRNA synthetase